jgi:hypothetical protein
VDYAEADELVFEVVRDGTPMFATVSQTAFPQTYRAMFGFCAKTNALKTAMFDQVESNNPYAFKALFRCFSEHYLKFTYIFVRFLRERSDDVGREYYSYCGAIESRDYLNALVLAERLVGNDLVGDIRNALATVYPDVGTLSTADLEAASAKFRYRSILRFLSSGESPFLSKHAPFLAGIVPSYAELSSFVHGGPWSDLDMQSYSGPEALQKCQEHAKLAFLMTASVFMFTAMAVSREFPAHGALASRTKAILDKFQARDPAGDA